MRFYLPINPYQRERIRKLLAAKKPRAAVFGQFFRDGAVAQNLSVRQTLAIRKIINFGRYQPARTISGIADHLTKLEIKP